VTGLKGHCPLSTCLDSYYILSALVSYLANISVCSFSRFFIKGTAKFLGPVQKQIVHFLCTSHHLIFPSVLSVPNISSQICCISNQYSEVHSLVFYVIVISILSKLAQDIVIY
jgi:hypothetical protein